MDLGNGPQILGKSKIEDGRGKESIMTLDDLRQAIEQARAALPRMEFFARQKANKRIQQAEGFLRSYRKEYQRELDEHWLACMEIAGA